MNQSYALRFFGILFLVSGLTLGSARAEQQDFTVWNAVFAQGDLSPGSNFGLFLESQTRLGSSEPASNRLLMRAAIRYKILPELSSFLGYGWTPNFSPKRNEHRFWEQLQWTHALESGTRILIRFRQEQRYIENTSSIAHRSRLMARVSHPISGTSLSAVVWDELFVGLNTVTRGPVEGYDQNRIFIGPGFSFDSGRIVLEPGYMNVLVRRPTANEGLMQHIWGLFLFVNW